MAMEFVNARSLQAFFPWAVSRMQGSIFPGILADAARK